MNRKKRCILFWIAIIVGVNVVQSDNTSSIAMSIHDQDASKSSITSSLYSYNHVRRSATKLRDTPINKVQTIGTEVFESVSCRTILSKSKDNGVSDIKHEFTEYHDASDLLIEKADVRQGEAHSFNDQWGTIKQPDADPYDFHYHRLRRNIQYLYYNTIPTSVISERKTTKSGLTIQHDKYLKEMVKLMISNQANEVNYTNDYHKNHHHQHNTHSHPSTDEHHDHHHRHRSATSDQHHVHHNHRHLASSVSSSEAGGMIEDPFRIGSSEDGGDECYFQSPSRSQMDKDEQLMRIWELIEDLSSIVDGEVDNTNEIRYVIPTYYHILLNSTDPLNNVDTTNERVTEYIQYLNQAFESSFINSGITTKRFEFVLQGITRTVNTSWSTNCLVEEVNYKSKLKVLGPYPEAAAGVFNIYQCRSIYDPIRNAAYNGFSSFPNPNTNFQIRDGVVLSRSNVGVSRLNTLVHEAVSNLNPFSL